MKEAPKEGGLTLWNKVVRNERISPSRKHTLGVIMHKRVSLDVEVPEHFVRAPAADEADDVGVDAGQEECRRASGAKTARRDLGRKETEVWPAGGDSVADLGEATGSQARIGRQEGDGVVEPGIVETERRQMPLVNRRRERHKLDCVDSKL